MTTTKTPAELKRDIDQYLESGGSVRQIVRTRRPSTAACRQCAADERKAAQAKKAKARTKPKKTKKATRKAGRPKEKPAKVANDAKSKRAVAVDPVETVLKAVVAMPESGRYNESKVYISEVWDRVGKKIGMSLPEFKQWLLEQNRRGTIIIARIDMAMAGSLEKQERSKVEHYGATFHAILDPTRR